MAVTAVTRHRSKLDIYPKVDDDATILLEMRGRTGIIEASWNWPFGIKKDLRSSVQRDILHAQNSKIIRERKKDTYENLEAKIPVYTSNLKYLADVLHGKFQPGIDLLLP